MKIGWGSLGIIVAVLVLSGSVFFSALRISQTVVSSLEETKRNLEKTQKELTQETRELTQELRRKLWRDSIALTYAFRRASIEDRAITTEDFEQGYQFVEELLIPTLAELGPD